MGLFFSLLNIFMLLKSVVKIRVMQNLLTCYFYRPFLGLILTSIM